MKISKTAILISVATLFVATIVFVQYFKTLAGNHRQELHQQLQTFLGSDVSFDGLEVTVWPWPGFLARDFRIADDARFAATPFARIKELRLGVSLWRLFLGRLFIDSVIFRDPEFQIITNEAGLLNTSALSSRKKELRGKLRISSTENQYGRLSFDIDSIRVVNGRLDFIDRSVKEPAELQIKNIEMEATDLDPETATKFKFTAALAAGLTHDMQIEGTLGPLRAQSEWSEQPLNVEMQFESLYLPSLARALPILRNKIPAGLKVTGPMSLQAKLTGTLQHPRITQVALKVPLFGSSDYNAIIRGSLVFPERGGWADANLNGTLALDRVEIAELRALPFVKQIVPAELVIEGPVNLATRFDGTWNTLRIGALAEASQSELRFGNWLRKTAGYPAKLRVQISRQNHQILLHESLLTLGHSKMAVAGLMDAQASKIQLKLRADRGPLKPWTQSLSNLSSYHVNGGADWNILLEKDFAGADSQWNIRGQLNLADAQLKDDATGTKVDQLNAAVVFFGPQARIENASFNLGASRIQMSAVIGNWSEPRATYNLSSQELTVADLPVFSVNTAIKLKNFISTGEIQFRNGLALRGTLTSSDGNMREIPYRDLRADIAWSPPGITVKNLSFQAFGGTVRTDGFWITNDQSHQFQLTPKLESVDARSLLAQTIPQLKDRIAGPLNFRGEFNASAQSGEAIQNVLNGSGEASIQNGGIADFNLINQFVLRGNSSKASRLTAKLVALTEQSNTPFESLKANFKIGQQGTLTGNVLLSTEDYVMSGSGSVKSDRTIKGDGLLLVSPALTQELQREYKTLRYFIDRRGRLSVSFRVEGKFPNVIIKPENRMLAQALRWSSPQSGDEAIDTNKKPSKPWFPRAFDSLLGR